MGRGVIAIAKKAARLATRWKSPTDMASQPLFVIPAQAGIWKVKKWIVENLVPIP
jgi:hypothetical protein